VEVANNLHQLAVEQWEKIHSNSGNSNKPPSGDNPFQKVDKSSRVTTNLSSSTNSEKKNLVQEQPVKKLKQKRQPGRQKGSKGFGRSKPVSISSVIPHYPNQCSACNQALRETEAKPYMVPHQPKF
jgi:transposase